MKNLYRFLLLGIVHTSQAVKYDLSLYFSTPDVLRIVPVCGNKETFETAEHAADIWLMQDICKQASSQLIDSLFSAVLGSEKYDLCFKLFSKLVSRYSITVSGNLESREAFASELIGLLNINSGLQAQVANVQEASFSSCLDYSLPAARLIITARFGLEEKVAQINYPSYASKDSSDKLGFELNDYSVVSSILNKLSGFPDFQSARKSLSWFESLYLKEGLKKSLEYDEYEEFGFICSSFIHDGGLICLEIENSHLSSDLTKLLNAVGVSFLLSVRCGNGAAFRGSSNGMTASEMD